jgi:auxin responsive GH3 gene family
MPEAPASTDASNPAAPPEAHREALDYIERVTASAGETQRRVLAEILAQNAPAEYLRRLGVDGAVEDFRRAAPLVTYEDILPDVLRIANGDTSPILSGKPIREFLTRYVQVCTYTCVCMSTRVALACAWIVC